MATYVERATAGLIEAITPPLAALSFLTVLPVPSVAQTRDVLGGALILLLEFAALATLPGAARAEALVLAPTLAHWAMALDVWAFPYARVEGQGTAFKAGLSRRHVVMATAWAGLVAAGLAPGRAVAAPRDRPAGTRPRPLDPRPAGRLDRRQLRGRERTGHRHDVRGALGEVVVRTPKPAGPAPRAPSVALRRAPPVLPAYGRPEKGAPRSA
jgi:hypothetical protein